MCSSWLTSFLFSQNMVLILDLGGFVRLYIVIAGIEIDPIVTNALIDMYAIIKCGNLQD